MQKFDLTIFREKRLYIGLLLLPAGLLGSIFVGVELGGVAFIIILFVVFLLLLGYFLIGYMTITIENEELHFQWRKKYFFNFRNIAPVKLSDINTIIVDDGKFLRKIKTSERTISINTSTIKPKDAAKLIQYLSNAAINHNIKTIDSWDVWVEKGYLKTAYWINTSILIAVGVVVIVAIVKGFFTRHFFWLLILLPQQFFFGQQMKRKMIK